MATKTKKKNDLKQIAEMVNADQASIGENYKKTREIILRDASALHKAKVQVQREKKDGGPSWKDWCVAELTLSKDTADRFARIGRIPKGEQTKWYAHGMSIQEMAKASTAYINNQAAGGGGPEIKRSDPRMCSRIAKYAAKTVALMEKVYEHLIETAEREEWGKEDKGAMLRNLDDLTEITKDFTAALRPMKV